MVATRGSVFSHLAEWRRARHAGSMEHTASGFRAGYGYEKGAQLISRVLRWEYADALIPTSSSSTWGAVKQSL